jgi:endogenous inhibitor of DNA gyrase (YacG/DUF329 family)
MAEDKDDKENVRKTTRAAPQAGSGASNVAPFAATGRGKPCPICGRPSIVEMRPFCSKRCADVDLSRWLGEVYRVPSTEPPASDEDSENRENRPEKA